MQFGSDKSQLAKYKWFEIMFIFQPSIKLAKNQCNCNFFFFLIQCFFSLKLREMVKSLDLFESGKSQVLGLIGLERNEITTLILDKFWPKYVCSC